MASYFRSNDIVTHSDAMRLRKKPEPDKLDSRARKLIYAMWHGVDHELTLGNGEIVQPGTPLCDSTAARAIGMPRRTLDYWRPMRVYKDALREMRASRFESEDPTNFAVAQSIRDNPVIDARTRLAAIDRLRVREPAAAVNVDLSHHDNRQQTLMAPAGYVVNLGESMKKVEENK